MSTRTDNLNLILSINGDKAREQLNELRKKSALLSTELKGMTANTQEYVTKSLEWNLLSQNLMKRLFIRYDLYSDNPSIYSALDKGCLAGLDIELEGDIPFRQFINVIDDDGEETFIPLKQITLMEFDRTLIYEEEDDGEELDDGAF